MTLTLGFDVGTTRTKALIYDTSTQQAVACVSAPTPVKVTSTGDYRDADEVWTLLARLCSDLVAAGAPLSQVRSVAVAALGEEIVFLDEKGLPTGPVACWYVEQSVSTELDEDPPMFRLASWYAIRNASRRQDSAVSDAHAFTDLGSSLLLRMLGSAHPFMDRSHASRTGLLDSETGEWSQRRLRSCGAAKLKQPRLVDSGTRIGVIDAASAAHLSLAAGITVGAGAHDHIAAALAAGARRAGDVLVSVGTSESRLMLLDLEWAELVKLEQPGWEVGHFADGRHRYIHSSALSGKRVSQIVASDLAGRDIASLYGALTGFHHRHVAGVPELPSARDHTMTALFLELDRQARQSAAAVDQMADLTGERTRRVLVAGVPTQHETWVHIRQDRSDRPLEVVRIEEPAAMGAAILAAQACVSTEHDRWETKE